MYTTSLPPQYALRPSYSRTPTYTAEPQAFEQRLALNRPARPPSGNFVKQAKNVSLRLFAQENNVALPVYGCGANVEGEVALMKTDGVTAVEVKIEGSLVLREVAGSGRTTYKLCLSTVTLWSKDTDSEPCSTTFKFSLTLPTTFLDGKDEYPLPPTHNVQLSGVPGFTADIHYSVSATATKNKATTLLRLGGGTVSTPFVYHPRSRPAAPLPSPMRQSFNTFKYIESPEWQAWESKMVARLRGAKDINIQLYLPSSRVFSITQPIPFHIMFSSSAFSLAAFMPYGPTATILAPNKHFTRIRVLRQSIVDVRNTMILGTKTNMWRVDTIGEGEFRHAGDGSDWLCFNGEIRLDPETRIGGFKAAGLSVKDFIELTMLPPDPPNAPFSEMRLVIPVRLTTDPWSVEGLMQAIADEFTPPSTPPGGAA